MAGGGARIENDTVYNENEAWDAFYRAAGITPSFTPLLLLLPPPPPPLSSPLLALPLVPLPLICFLFFQVTTAGMSRT